MVSPGNGAFFKSVTGCSESYINQRYDKFVLNVNIYYKQGRKHLSKI